MAEEISFHTENLEQIVAERTAEIEDAKEEISTLNAQLERENRRLGTELAVAERIQMMVLPLEEELQSFPTLEVAGYMRPLKRSAATTTTFSKAATGSRSVSEMSRVTAWKAVSSC